MTDTSNVQHLPARPARRRKSTATAPVVATQPAFIGAEIAMALGELTGVVAGMQEAVSEMKSDARRERDESIESRGRIHESIDDLKDRVHAIDKKMSQVLDVDARVSGLDTRMASVEAEAAKTRRIREWTTHVAARGWKMGIGALGLTGVGAAVRFRDHLAVAAKAIHDFFL